MARITKARAKVIRRSKRKSSAQWSAASIRERTKLFNRSLRASTISRRLRSSQGMDASLENEIPASSASRSASSRISEAERKLSRGAETRMIKSSSVRDRRATIDCKAGLSASGKSCRRSFHRDSSIAVEVARRAAEIWAESQTIFVSRRRARTRSARSRRRTNQVSRLILPNRLGNELSSQVIVNVGLRRIHGGVTISPFKQRGRFSLRIKRASERRASSGSATSADNSRT